MKVKNKGFFIIEALIAVLVFMIGILGVLQIQLTQMQATADAQYRMQASYMADNIMSKIVLDKSNLNNYVSGSNDEYTTWFNDLKGVLPAVSDNPPVITTSESPNGGTLVKIIIKWKSPQTSIVSNYELQSVVF